MSSISDIERQLDLACVKILKEHGREPGAWLKTQWEMLNDLRPIVQFDYLSGAETWVQDVNFIDAELSLIAYVDDELLWGSVNNRPESFPKIINGLLSGFNHGSYREWLKKMDRIQLCEIPGIYGPLYRVGGDTRHRVHALVGLRLKAFPAQIECMKQATIIDLADRRRKPRGASRFQRLTSLDIPSQMAGALLQAGYLERLDATRYQVLYELPGPWLFSYTWADIALASKRYQISYPRYGFTPLEKMSLDASLAKQFVKEHRK